MKEPYLTQGRGRLWRPQDVDLFLWTDGDSGSDVPITRRFRIPTPDCRARTRVSLVMDLSELHSVNILAASAVDYFGVLTLWAAMTARGRSARRSAPVQNLIATRATPLTIPTDVGLWGYSFEVETKGEEIFGQVAATSIPDIGGADNEGNRLLLQVEYGALEPMAAQEWDRLVSKAQPTADPTAVIASS